MGNGKTPGKILFRLRVVPADNPMNLLSFTESIKRTFGYMFCYLTGFVLFAIPYFNKNRSGIPDMFSNSKVLTEQEYLAYREVAKQEQSELEVSGVQMELDFKKVVNENIIYLPGPEYFSPSDEEDDDEKVA